MQQSQPSIDYLAILRRRIHWLIWPALLVFLAAAAVALSLPNIYKSEAVIMIEGQQIAEKLVSSTVTTYADQRIQTIEREMLSRSKILDLVKKFDLYPDQRQKISTDALVEKVKESISITPLSAEVKTGRSDRPASITIAFILSFEGKSPRKVQAVVNDLAAFFLAKAEKEKQSISELDKKIAKFKEAHIEELPEFMQLNLQKVEKINEKMNNTDQQILALQEQSIMVKYKLAFVNPYSGADGRALSNEEKLQELELKYNEFKSKYSEKHPKVNALKKEIEILRSMVDQFQDLNQKRNRLKELEQNLAQLLSRYSDQHPVVRRIKAEIKELKKEIEAEENYGNNIGKTGQENIRNVTNPAYIHLQSELDRINLRLASLENEKKALIEEEEQIYTKLRTMPDVEKRYKDLLMDRENVKQNLNELQRKLQVAMVAEGMEEGRLGENFTMTQPPFLPDEPYKPNRIAIMLLGLILGMGVSVGMAALKEYTDHSVRLPEEIERLSMHTVLAVIPNIPSPGERRKKIA
jgi:succinoglycan biosynthesis transport protein ExoP